MKKARIIENKTKDNKNTELENDLSVKKLVIIILVVAAIFSAFYFITSLVVKPAKDTNTSSKSVKTDDSEILLNHLLDREDKEYYVLATKKSLYDDYSSKVDYIKLYKDYIEEYKGKENSLNIYFADLDDTMNKSYISDELNISSDLSSLKLNDEVLFKIKNGEIEDYYVGSKSIIEALSKLN